MVSHSASHTLTWITRKFYQLTTGWHYWQRIFDHDSKLGFYCQTGLSLPVLYCACSSKQSFIKLSPLIPMCYLLCDIYRLTNPFGMMLGGMVVTLVFMGSVWAAENKAMIKNFKRQNPTLFVFAVMLASYFLMSLFGGVMVFIFGISFPLLCKSAMHAKVC